MSMDITSANATVVLSCDLFNETLQQFSTDTSFEGEDDQMAETRMGVDGKMVAGMTPSVKAVTIHLEASSPSYERLTLLKQSMASNRKVYECSMVISIPSIGKRITYSHGVLQSAKDLPDGKKVLDPTTWTFHFEQKNIETM
jgi:hypothetical protein